MLPLILTLKFDAESFALLDGLRRRYFPPERNFIPAHVTLFHALPGEREEQVRGDLARVCAVSGRLPLRLPGVRFLGRGTAVEIGCPELLQLRANLAAPWREFLTPQDAQKYRPHVTVQNKVAPEVARAIFQELSATWKSVEARGEGLLLWRYLGGPWEPVEEFPFDAG